eukprot:1493153-Amphidinium_carterae.1
MLIQLYKTACVREHMKLAKPSLVQLLGSRGREGIAKDLWPGRFFAFQGSRQCTDAEIKSHTLLPSVTWNAA